MQVTITTKKGGAELKKEDLTSMINVGVEEKRDAILFYRYFKDKT